MAQVLTLGIAEYVLMLRDDLSQQAARAFDNTEARAANLSTGLHSVGLAATAMGAGIVGGLALGMNSAIDFEAAFTNVAKTVSATDEELEAIRSGIRQMAQEIPVTTSELAEIASSAGQLGIQTPNILSFTRTIADLGVASNLAGDEGASMLAKFANITGMPQTEFQNLGSAIVDLGNNSATTEADIMAMGLRLAGAGTIAGMTEGDILGIAASLSSVGIEAEAGGSAFSKVIIDMANAAKSGGEQLEGLARVAGMSAEQFAQAWNENPAQAIVAFIGGLQRIQEEGGNTFQVLDELGYSEIRLRDALLRSTTAGDLMTASITRGNEAWAENTALLDEAERFYGTTESQLKILGNAFNDLGIAIGSLFLGEVKSGTEALSQMVFGVANLIESYPMLSTAVIGTVAAFGGLLLVLGPIALTLSSIITISGAVASALGALGLAGTAAAGTAAAGAAAGAAGAAGGGALVAVGGGAAAGVAGGVGLAGVASAGFAAAAGLIAIAGAAAVGTAALLLVSGAVRETDAAYDGLEASQRALDETERRYIETLRAKGVALSEAAMASMSYAERQQYLALQEQREADATLRAWIVHYTGRIETEQEFGQAKNLLLNENLTAEQAAAVAVMDLAEEKKAALMRANAEETDSMLRELGIQETAAADVHAAIAYSSQTAALDRQDAWISSAMAVNEAETALADATLDRWSQVGNYIQEWLSWLLEQAKAVFAFLGGGDISGFAPPPSSAPGMATGGLVRAGGLVQVHRDELLLLPRGAEVIPRSHTAAVRDAMSGGGGGNVTVTFSGPVMIGNGMDAEAVGRKIGRAARREMQLRGVGI